MNLKSELDKLPRTEANKTLRLSILSMDAACDELETPKTRHDINNIRAVIHGAVMALQDGDMMDADFMLSEAAKSINKMVEKPIDEMEKLANNHNRT